jgi:methenyltetrahydromethanopterin cyclohydrolase
MGSGPMRAVRGREPIYDTIGFRETENSVVGVLETRQPPPHSVMAAVAAECKVLPSSVTLLAAPTASLAGGVQVVARSVETAMHKRSGRKVCRGSTRLPNGTCRSGC